MKTLSFFHVLPLIALGFGGVDSLLATTGPANRAMPNQVSGTRANYSSAMSKPISKPKPVDDEKQKQQKQTADIAQAAEAAAAASARDSSQPRIYVRDVNLVGNTRFDAATLRAAIAADLGKKMTFAQVQQLAIKVETYYKEHNYQVVRVSIPRGGLKDSVLTLKVVEGKLEKIDVQGNNRYSKERIVAAMEESLQVGHIFSMAQAERPLVLLNTYPGLSVASALSAGSVDGTTMLTVAVKEQRMLTGSLEMNNFGSKDAGEYRMIPYIALLNPSGLGDKLSLFAALTPEQWDTWSYQVNYDIAINNRGTSLSVYYGQGKNSAGNEFEILDINGESASWGFGVTHKYIISATTQFDFKLMFDAQNTDQSMLGMRTMDDHVRKLRLGADFSHSDANGKSFASLYLHQGLGETFGGMENSSELSSRAYAGGDNDFTKFSMSAMRLQSFSEKFYAIFNMNAQASLDPLVATEQIYIGGANSVRGQPYSMSYGDDGFIINAELRYNVRESAPSLQLATFFDYASTHQKKPMMGYDDWLHAAGAGVGLRSRLFDGVDLRFDVATPIGRDYGDNVYLYGQLRYAF